MSDQCPTCGASPSSRAAVMRTNLDFARRLREADEERDELIALLMTSRSMLRDAYSPELGVLIDIDTHLFSRLPPTAGASGSPEA